MSRSSEVAQKIDAHLRKWEADRGGVNKSYDGRAMGTRPYYQAGAFALSGWVRVVYVSYQGGAKMRADRAERYLAWIEAGNVGRHYEAEREMARQKKGAKE